MINQFCKLDYHVEYSVPQLMSSTSYVLASLRSQVITGRAFTQNLIELIITSSLRRLVRRREDSYIIAVLQASKIPTGVDGLL